MMTFLSFVAVMGVPYDPSLDIWSIGCTLYELYTGKILFPGRSNNQMILLMMELKGRFNTKMIKKAKFGDVYFDDLGAFQSVEKDRITGTVRNFRMSVYEHRTDYASIGRRAENSHHEAVTRPACPTHAPGFCETQGRRT